MRISVIGCGYLGATHAAAMAHLGHDVIGVDINEEWIELLRQGEPPFFEPELADLLKDAVAEGRLRFTTDIAEASDADVHFIAVGTPQVEGGTAADMRHVNASFESLLPHVKPGALIVGKSTVPVGTSQRLHEQLQKAGLPARLMWNPEFLREGYAVRDTLRPDRLVYGVADPESDADRAAVAVLDAVYSDALAAGVPRMITNFPTTELVKIAANAFLATKISFINAMSEISDAVGADVISLADAIGYDERIGRKFLGAGAGFGGGCLPKDIRAFIARAEELDMAESVTFLKEVDTINMRQRERVVSVATDMLGGSVFERRVTVLGVTFKANSDDVRDSPALDVAVRLKGLGAHVVCTDPKGLQKAQGRHPQLAYEPDLDRALEGSELVILMTEWDSYRTLDPVATATRVDSPRMLDGRNVFDVAAWRAAGWTYRGLGRR